MTTATQTIDSATAAARYKEAERAFSAVNGFHAGMEILASIPEGTVIIDTPAPPAPPARAGLSRTKVAGLILYR
jgi:hypothetical protein